MIKVLQDKKNANIPYKEILSHYFSMLGTLGRTEFLGIMVSAYLLLKISMHLNLILNDIVYLPVFYSMLAATQKRCRDIHWSGNFFIILFSLAFPFINYYQYMKANDMLIPQNLKDIVFVLGVLYFFSYIILLLIPGKEQKDKIIRSPLLKHPHIYSGLFFILFLVGQCIFFK